MIPPGVSARLLTLAASVLLLAFTTYLFTQVRSGPDIGPSPEGHPGASAPGSSGGTSLGPSRGPSLGHSLGPLAPARATPPAPAPTEPTPSQPQAAPAPDPVTPVAPPALAAQIESSADLAFDEANRRYDQRDYDEARSLALSLLRTRPDSARMRRIVVSASCIMGELDVAQTHYSHLPERDRADMRRRCAQYGAAFRE